MIERPLCPCCGAQPAKTVIGLPFADSRMQEFFVKHYGGRVEQSALAGGDYRIERCVACGLLWQRWILDERGMEQLYGTWINSGESSKKRQSATLRLQYARHCARLLRLFPNPQDTRLLDFGMGWGEWCEMAKAFGFQVHGVELSQERIERARANGISASLPDQLPEGQFDFLYLEQVLEHLPTPGDTLRMLLAKLKPGGYIHIGVPDASAVERHAVSPERLLCKGPAQPLEHINLFTPASLKAVLKLHGCLPARQHEMLLRTRPLPTFLADCALCVLRMLPATVFPPGTSLMFRKG